MAADKLRWLFFRQYCKDWLCCAVGEQMVTSKNPRSNRSAATHSGRNWQLLIHPAGEVFRV